MRILLSSIAFTIFLLPATSLWGQTATPAQFSPAAQRILRNVGVPKKPTSTTKAKPGAAVQSKTVSTAKEHEQARLTKLKAMKFDRRRSSYIKAWADIGKKEKPKKKEDKSKEDKKKPVTKPKKEPTEAEKKAAALKKKNEADLKKLDNQIIKAQKDVTLGQWDNVKAFIKSLKKEEAKVAYAQLLASLQTPPPTPGAQNAAYMEKSLIQVDDLMAVAEMAPHHLDFSDLKKLSGLLRISLQSGHSIEEYMVRFREISKKVLASYKIKDVKARPHFPINRFQIAKILVMSNHAILIKEFTMDLERAMKEKNRGELNHLSVYYLTLYHKDRKTEDLDKAWQATREALSEGKIKEHTKKVAFKRVVELSAMVKPELSIAWLTECFDKRPELGKEILSSIGSAAAINLSSQLNNSSSRLTNLKLQNTAVKALLKTSPQRAKEWQTTLQLLAENWLNEAKLTKAYDYSASSSPSISRDMFGNYFYPGMYGQTQNRGNHEISAIPTGEMLKLTPGKDWIVLLPTSIKPHILSVIAGLHLKVKEDEKAFPYIEKLATMDKKVTRGLVEQFLRVWAKNHDPNTTNRYTNPYMMIYGISSRATGIPLTRSKQDRNLKELAKWIKKIQALPIEEIDEDLILSTFIRIHSSAEVYKLEHMEQVFGNVDKLKPKTYASLVQTMRANLASIWRIPAVQKKAKTNRKQLDIQQEVHRGYLVARAMLKRGMKKYPDDWSMRLAKASLDFDSNEYQRQLEDSTKYAGRKKGSLADFEKAAEQYTKEAITLKKNKQTTKAFETWFYASLGAPDLGNLKSEKSSDPKQLPLIKQAILSMPKETATHHMNMFANNLFTRLSSVDPAMKFRFLSAGFKIVGDNERAVEAKKVFDYYKDIVTEIELETTIDGSDVIGIKEPFGVFVNIHHTKQIERESGGFAKYLQNQTNSYYYMYNYGRPVANYRDKFEEAATKALEEHFEILSVTFQSEDVHSRATAKPGWRITPYAYLLLKPKGVEVDKLPVLKLDLDFQDTTGHAVLPVSSSPIPLDASKEPAQRENYKSVAITETLDEREADSGKLKLEIKATAVGLVPDLKQLVDLKPKGFDVDNIEDEGVSVSHFDKESGNPEIVSERTWMISMKANPQLNKQPESFEFAKPVIEAKEIVYQRFVDADLASVGSVISLEEQYGDANRSWIYVLIGVVALLIIGIVGYNLLRKPQQETVIAGYQIPEEITPFTVLGLLRSIHQNNGLSPTHQDELGNSIDQLEEHYFHQNKSEEPDLQLIAQHWVKQTS